MMALTRRFIIEFQCSDQNRSRKFSMITNVDFLHFSTTIDLYGGIALYPDFLYVEERAKVIPFLFLTRFIRIHTEDQFFLFMEIRLDYLKIVHLEF